MELTRRTFLTLGFAVIAAEMAPKGLLACLEPNQARIYDVNGQTAFPEYDAGGHLTTKVLSFVLLRAGDEIYSYGFDPREEKEEHALARLEVEVRNLQ